MALTKLNNQSLTAVTSAGIPIRSGNVLQALNTNFKTQTTETSTSTPSATGLTQSITPLFANSKLLVQIHANGVYNSVTSGGVHLFLYRDGSAVTLVSGEGVAGRFAHSQAYNTGGQSVTSAAFSKVVDSGSTSATTFQLYISCAGSGTAYINVNQATSSMTVMEIAG